MSGFSIDLDFIDYLVVSSNMLLYKQLNTLDLDEGSNTMGILLYSEKLCWNSIDSSSLFMLSRNLSIPMIPLYEFVFVDLSKFSRNEYCLNIAEL